MVPCPVLSCPVLLLLLLPPLKFICSVQPRTSTNVILRAACLRDDPNTQRGRSQASSDFVCCSSRAWESIKRWADLLYSTIYGGFVESGEQSQSLNLYPVFRYRLNSGIVNIPGASRGKRHGVGMTPLVCFTAFYVCFLYTSTSTVLYCITQPSFGFEAW